MLLNCKQTGNNHFRKKLEKQAKLFLCMLPLFLLICAFGIVNETFSLISTVEIDFANGVFTGFGFAGGIVCIARVIYIKSILKNEAKLKEERIKNTDERTLQISLKALSTASGILIAVSYIALLVFSFFSKEISLCFAFVIIFFMWAYLIAYKILEKIM